MNILSGGPPTAPCRLPRVGACALVLAPLSLSELRAVVFGLSSSPACGEDDISIHVFRACFESIGEMLLHFLNSSIAQSDVLQPWKHSLVHPILKSGALFNTSNFRPVFIVPVITKILERAVHQQLYSYLSEKHLSPNWHGFRPIPRKPRSHPYLNHILSTSDHGEVTCLYLLDLSKCFDVIGHSKLLSKLPAHEINTSWFAAYLQNHTQSVTDNHGEIKKSRPLPNNTRVFQSSALGSSSTAFSPTTLVSLPKAL